VSNRERQTGNKQGSFIRDLCEVISLAERLREMAEEGRQEVMRGFLDRVDESFRELLRVREQIYFLGSAWVTRDLDQRTRARFTSIAWGLDTFMDVEQDIDDGTVNLYFMFDRYNNDGKYKEFRLSLNQKSGSKKQLTINKSPDKFSLEFRTEKVEVSHFTYQSSQ